jgi:hypothetical protein
MFLKNTAYFYFLIVIGFMIGGCKKVPHYPVTPSIEFDRLWVVADSSDRANGNYTDSVYIMIKFKDGDGDLGNSPLKDNDYFVNVYKKTNGVYNIVNMGALSFSGKLPFLSGGTGSAPLVGPIDGTIKEVLSFDYIDPNAFGFHKDDTLRFDVQIKDRANNYSNIVTTSEYVLWQYFP